MKKCTRCGEVKDESEFSKNKSSKDGLEPACKVCRKARYQQNKDEMLAYQKAYYQQNKDKVSAYHAQHYEQNKDKAKAYYQQNKEKLLAQGAKWRAENKDKIASRKKTHYQQNKDKIRAYQAQYTEENKPRLLAMQAKYRSVSLLSTPEWLDAGHWAEMEAEYALSLWCSEVMGEKYHVDHIVPLKGKKVCGLHVPWNLQVIPAVENRRKKNKLLVD
jgi:hypothetical protein